MAAWDCGHLYSLSPVMSQWQVELGGKEAVEKREVKEG